MFAGGRFAACAGPSPDVHVLNLWSLQLEHPAAGHGAWVRALASADTVRLGVTRCLALLPSPRATARASPHRHRHHREPECGIGASIVAIGGDHRAHVWSHDEAR